MSKQKRTIALDFDGVLHKYNGYQNGKIDVPIAGALDAVNALLDAGNTVVVFSTRDKTMIESWLRQHDFPELKVTNVKEPFYVIVDDRAVTFEGVWSADYIDTLKAFEPYWIRARNSGGQE